MDKQMIEELATEILEEFTRCYSEADKDCLVKMIRKYIPENAVVLTREEYDKLSQKIGDLQYDKDILKQLEEENIDLKYDKFELKNEISEKDNKIALLEETIECIKFNVDFTRKETAEKFAEMAKKRLEEYRLSEEWEEEDNQWRLDSSIFCAEVLLDGGLIDEICKEMVDGK